MTLSEEDLLVIQAADDGASVLFGVILTNLLVIILKWENDIWWWTILLIIISLLSLRPVFVGNETLVLSEAGIVIKDGKYKRQYLCCLLYTSPSPRDVEESRMPSSA